MSRYFESFKNFLGQPYPFYYFRERAAILFTAIFAFSFVFLYFFEPFTVNREEHRMDYFWICLLHAGQPTLLALLYFWILEKLTRDYDLWTVGKEFLHVSILLLLIGIGSFLVRDIIYFNPYNWSWRYFLEEIRNTFLIGFLILAIFVPLNYVRLLRQYVKQAESVPPGNIASSGQNEPKAISIKTEVISDDFEMISNELLFARADGNYMELFFETNGKVVKLIKRIRLKELEEQLRPIPYIFKTHRAYLVNLQKVCITKGNAQGYQLKLNGVEEKIPVSRSMIEQFKKEMKAS